GPNPARTLQFTPLSFDVSCQEIFTTWCTGGALVLVTDELRQDGEALLAYLKTQRIERLFLPFIALQNLAESVTHQSPPEGLRDVITAGEQLHITPAIAHWFRQSECRLHNHYGPTESHVVSAYSLTGVVSAWPTLPPIGRPVANTQLYILDHDYQPVPLGVTGELYLGGGCLARGYLHRPELTAERFIPDPFGAGRLYKTGDLARYRPDGSIEFLGRADDQVKLRGFRIELGEIEAVLSQHPAVLETAVLAREDDGHPKQLVAYVVPGEERPSLVSDLRSHLSNIVPDYMIPAAFVRLDTLPLTPSGKVDRRALPAPQLTGLETGYVAPQTPIEDILAAIWSEVLGLAQVSRHDNFFDLGGHSLLATQVISRVRDSFEVALPVRTVFEAASIAELAFALETARQIEHPVPVPPPIRAVARDGDVPLSFAQQRLWFLDRMIGPSAAYNFSGALQLHGSLDVAALEQALNEIVRRHEILRTAFPSVNGEPVQRIESSSTLPLLVVDLQELANPEREAELNRLASHEMAQPFDLAQGPLLRVTLYQLGEREQVLLVHMHHIVSDGWSMRVWWRELDILYRAFMVGTPSPLPALSLQYADFSQWQREWLTGEVLEQQLGYWQQQLAHAPTRLELPTDHPRPSVQSFNGQVERFEIAPATLSQLRALSHRCAASLFMTLYGALAVLLSRYSGQEDLIIGSPIANRHYQEIEPLIGFFVNTLPLRADLSGDPSFTELLNRVRQTTLEAYTHQDMPFEQLVSELEVERNLSHPPLFQVVLAWQDIFPESVVLGDVKVALLEELDMTPAKFDLVLYLDETQSEAGVGLRGEFEYNTDLFERATITRMIGHF
ncbi:MAG: condensation domain-containing protein, partial [Candidatus Tectomicrobia bacterium]|nr:condensation domain-containing protein [Candidatus Tectomicrobia bacterium]